MNYAVQIGGEAMSMSTAAAPVDFQSESGVDVAPVIIKIPAVLHDVLKLGDDHRGYISCTCASSSSSSGSSICGACKELVLAIALPRAEFEVAAAIASSPVELRQFSVEVQKFLDALTQVAGPNCALRAACAIQFALFLRVLGDCDAAIKLWESGLKVYAGDALLRANTKPGALADHAEFLGAQYRRNADLPNAKRALFWALSFRRESLGPLHAATTETEYMLGVCSHEMEDYEGAEGYFRSAFAHEREAGCEGRIAKRCCDLSVGLYLMDLAIRHFEAGRLQRALGLQQMAATIAERVCDKCLERGDLENALSGIAGVRISELSGNRPAAEVALKVPHRP
eukprot:tig00000310_g23972.t1